MGTYTKEFFISQAKDYSSRVWAMIDIMCDGVEFDSILVETLQEWQRVRYAFISVSKDMEV